MGLDTPLTRRRSRYTSALTRRGWNSETPLIGYKALLAYVDRCGGAAIESSCPLVEMRAAISAAEGRQ